MMTTMMKDAVG